jgi:hypothetical protein
MAHTVQGFRRNLTDALVANCPGFGARKDRTANLARINGYIGEFGMENWHRVDHSGIATDRNTNSGVLPKARVLELCEACDVLNGEVPGIPCTCGDTAEVFE